MNARKYGDRGSLEREIERTLPGGPLEAIHQAHLREREVCAMLDRLLPQECPCRAEIAPAVAFLGKDLPLHLEDEEQDLLPLLGHRVEPDDEIAKVIERLTADHRHAHEAMPAVIADLEALACEQGAPCVDMCARFRQFAAHARRDLILENAIVLPFARLRLTADHLETLRFRMAERRGFNKVAESRRC